jgi:sulfur-carrier protein adenylyltransferase/sulfurtransferase
MQTGGNQAREIPEITPKELKERLDRKDPIVLLDVREPHEAAIADLPEVGQLRIPMRELPARAGELDPASELIIYCRSGARSGKITLHLKSLGFERVFNLKGGMLKWREDVDPSVRAY